MKKMRVDLEKLYGAMRGKIGEFSERYGLHRNTVSNKLNQRAPITFDDLNKFAEFLGRDAIEFIDEIEIAA